MATASAIRSIAPVTKKTPRQPNQVANHAGAGRPQQIAAHCRKQQPANRHLPLLNRDTVAGHGQSNRKNAAGGNTGDHTQRHQRFEIRRKAASHRRDADDEHASRNQSRLAEHIGKRAQHRLDQSVRQGEPGR